MQLTWIGIPGDPTEAITQYGLTFERGKAVTVPDDHRYADKFRNNPTFAAKKAEVKDAAEADEAVEKDMLREWLEERGVDVDGRWSLATLQEKHDEIILAENRPA